MPERNRLSVLLIPLLFTACAPLKDIPGPAATVTRAQTLTISRAYTQLVWQGTAENALHATDADGIRVDTPDAGVKDVYPGAWWRVNAKSKGMPYKWGGWDTPNEFLARLKSDGRNGGAMRWSADLRQGWIVPASYPVAGDCISRTLPVSFRRCARPLTGIN